MRMLPSVVSAGVPALMLMLGAATPVAGVWEGTLHGAKAVTLTVRDKGDRIEGTAVFYIIRDDDSGTHNGSASGEIPLTDPVWDGRVLRFSVHGPHGEGGQFAMKLTAPSVAELTVEGRDTALEMIRLK